MKTPPNSPKMTKAFLVLLVVAGLFLTVCFVVYLGQPKAAPKTEEPPKAPVAQAKQEQVVQQGSVENTPEVLPVATNLAKGQFTTTAKLIFGKPLSNVRPQQQSQ